MLRYGALVALLAVAVSGQGNVQVPESGSASFQSHNFGNGLYDNNHMASWQVTGPEGHPMQFDAESFDLEASCSYDYVEILEDGKSLGKFCGTDGPNGVRTSGNSATVNFKTDSSINRPGFKINVKVAKCPAGVNSCPNHEDVCMSSNAWCNGHQDCPDGADEECPDLGDCGKSAIPQLTQDSKGHKIVGGIEAAPHSWPWQIAFLSSTGFQFCGGSIISDRWIMTAAHCCAGRSASSVKVRVGAHNLNSNTEGAVNHDIERIVNHPQYSTRPSTNQDFCLLKTKTPINFNNRNVAPACLPQANSALEATGTECFISGWGTTASGGSSTSKLLQTSVAVSEQSFCNSAYGNVITDQMICAASPGRDTCQGDSGGPFVCKDAEGKFNLIGVTSWGRGCAMAGYPGVYARTSTALEWIMENIIQG